MEEEVRTQWVVVGHCVAPVMEAVAVAGAGVVVLVRTKREVVEEEVRPQWVVASHCVALVMEGVAVAGVVVLVQTKREAVVAVAVAAAVVTLLGVWDLLSGRVVDGVVIGLVVVVVVEWRVMRNWSRAGNGAVAPQASSWVPVWLLIAWVLLEVVGEETWL